jgi:hypothetical protein
VTDIPAPSYRSIWRRGLPGFLREGFLPLGCFYVGHRTGGLAGGMAAAAAAALVIYASERRAGRDGLLVRLSLAFVAVQTAIGLVAQSTTAYLAAPVLVNAAWGLAFLGSAAVGRPLAGALAHAWYPFPRELRELRAFRRIFAVESLVWGLYLLGRSALRLAALQRGSLDGFLVVSLISGTPATLLLLAWSMWYARRGLIRAGDEPQSAAVAVPRRHWRVSGRGVSSGSTRWRRLSKAGGRLRRSPRLSSGSSDVNPGPIVASSKSTPLGSRK